MKKSIVIILVLLVAVVGVVTILPAQTQTEQAQQATVSVKPSVPVQNTTVTYNGKEGVDALTILKESRTVEQNSSGLVTTIGGRKAEDSKREYWAFYINGKMATVGPADYVTKDTDKIEWKVENY